MKMLILADNQDITKAGILYFAAKMPAFALIREAADKKELVALLTVAPDAAVILDYTLFDLAGTDELMIFQERFKKARWLLFCEDLSEDFIRRVLCGSDSFGILMKDSPQEEITEALQSLSRSDRFICARIANLLANRKKAIQGEERPALTATEREILKSIAQGKTTREIAAERFSSIHTITTHRKNIFRKLDINNIHEATRYALRAGIIDSAEYYI